MIIHPGLISLDCPTTDKLSTIRFLVDLGYQDKRVLDSEALIKSVLERENEYSTGVGFGIAIPHGKSDAVVEPMLAFAKVNQVDWDSMDSKPVDLVFLIGVPASDTGSLHLKILANLSRKLMKDEFRQSLRDANSATEIMDLFSQFDILPV